MPNMCKVLIDKCCLKVTGASHGFWCKGLLRQKTQHASITVCAADLLLSRQKR